ERADEVDAAGAAAEALDLSDVGDLWTRVLNRLLDPGVKRERRGGAAVAGAGKADGDRRRLDVDEFDVAAVRGEHRAHAFQRPFDPLSEAGLEDLVATKHR